MSDHTMFIKNQVDEFFKVAEADIEEVLQTAEVEKHNAFMKRYIRVFPTMGDYAYEHIFRSKGLGKYYEDYTLEVSINGIGDTEVEKSRRSYNGSRGKPFYIHYYHKYILEKTKNMEAAGIDPGLKSFLKHWPEKLEKQGYQFMHSTKESVTARNIAFHLAFALGMDTVLLKNILLKCLLQQVFNPKNHKECIFWYCLDNKISYGQMRSDYLDYYNSDAFDEKYRNSVEKGIANTPTQMLEADIRKVMAKSRESFLRYLWRLKYTEKLIAEKQITEFGKVPGERVLKRGTPSDVYWENICHFVDEEDPSIAEKLRTEGEYPLVEEYEARFPEIWEQRRKECYEKNQDPLLDMDILKELFSGIDYSKRGIDNRKLKSVDPARTEIIATQFIARCTRGPARDLSRIRLRKDFLKEVNEDLVDSGLRMFYLGSPFELFITLCFLHEDPFSYFMASWEAAVRACTSDYPDVS